MNGRARIYSFPFRIYAEGDLGVLNGSMRSGSRVRVYPFFTVRPRNERLSPAVPFSKWPNFSWSPGLPQNKRLKPPSVDIQSIEADHAHDAVRIDVWGSTPEVVANDFVSSYLSWVRLFTGQEWIGEFEPHTDPLLKNDFRIDRDGRAISEPYSYGSVALRKPWWSLLTNELQETAFRWTLTGTAPPLYWMLFLDASLYWASAKEQECVMALALSLEVARDTIYPKFARVKKRKGTGDVLADPFDGTDLLRHLTTALQSVGKPSLESDRPDLHSTVEQLYRARHHAAHGKPLITTADGQRRKLVAADLEPWLLPTFSTLKWIEELPRRS